MGPRVLLTGGAGYVGSHCARLLVAEGFDVVVLDDLSTGYQAALSSELVEVDLRDRDAVHSAVDGGFDCVLHVARRIAVGESVRLPIEYFEVNVTGTINLLLAIREVGCSRLVFSSTAAVYGLPEVLPISESAPIQPINPYGGSKATVERLLGYAEAAGWLSSARLRYFNACGASDDAWIGEAHVPETHLIPLALRAAHRGQPFKVFGDDYPTPDGTCIRDYIDVRDLARAHLAAVRHLLDDGPGGAWNLGTGRGVSVAEVLDVVESVTGHSLDRHHVDRRPGDPAVLLADPILAGRELGWVASHTLEESIHTAWQWYQHPRFGPRP